MLISLLLLDTLAITGGTVHTMVPGSTPAVMTILVENERITAVGADVKVPEGAQTLDAAGLHVIPGLIDGFVNLDPDHDRLYVAAGVTLVRDWGNDQARILGEAQYDARKRSPGPWIWSAGSVLDGSPPTTTASVVLDTPADVDAKLPRLFDMEGIDFLSFQGASPFSAGLPHDAWVRVLELAHRAKQEPWTRRQVWGALARDTTLAEAIEKGQDGLYKLDAFLPAGASFETVQPAALDANVAAAGAAKLAVTPLLAVYARQLIPPPDGLPQLDYLGPMYEVAWQRDLEARARLVDEAWLKSGLAILDAQSKLVARLHAAGCRLVPGSGAPSPWHMPGEGLLDELTLWKRAGISAADCVRAATQQSAETIGATKRGTIEVGKIADCVLTKGDPTQDLANLHAPETVVLRGRVMRRHELDALVADVKAQQAKVKDLLRKPLTVAPPDLPAGDVVLTGHVETRGLGTRFSAERYAVVRRYDGSLTYCGHVVVPGEATTPGTDTTVQQTIQGGELSEFTLTIASNRHRITVHGEGAGGKFSIERRDNDAFVDTNYVKERPAFVDCGSMTAQLILGYHKKPGIFPVMFFDDYEPAYGPWEMRLDQGALHLVRTPSGAMKVSYDDKGNIKYVERQAGNSIRQTLPLEASAPDGKGLPMPADKRALVPATPEPAGADSTKPDDKKTDDKKPGAKKPAEKNNTEKNNTEKSSTEKNNTEKGSTATKPGATHGGLPAPKEPPK